MATLPSPQRRLVVWVGDALPASVRDELGRWGMEASAGDPAAVTRREREVRAVLLQHSSDAQHLRKTLARLRPALDTGALLAVVIPTEAERGEAIRLTSEAEDSADNRVIVLSAQPPHEVARECGYHDPGRPAHRGLQIIDPVGCVPDVYRVLFQRAFSDFHHVEVTRLTGGLSDVAGVWRVLAYDAQGRHCEPFVVKGGPRRPITQEIDTTLANVLDFVPFPHCPPLLIDRCVEGAATRLVVSRFVDRATRFDEYVLLGSPGLAVAAIFDGPLRIWRANALPAELQLGKEYVRFGVLPKAAKAAELAPAYEVARQAAATLPDPVRLFDIIGSLPKVRVWACHAHGDLHARNIFVRRNSMDVILIDFASARYIGPSSRDPATLDVALAVDVCDRDGALLDVATVRSLYTPPLLPARALRREDGRLEAIRQLRVQAAGEGISPAEYAFSVACYLLRFARFPTPPDTPDAATVGRLKALAYELAAGLLL